LKFRVVRQTEIFKNEYLYKFGIMKQFSDIKEKVVSNLIANCNSKLKQN